MSRPPTPVSSCPLRRLQVRSGPETSVYEAARFAGGLALTLDGQRSTHTGRDSLMLLVHCALRQMLSIRLSDLLQHPHGAATAISANKDYRRLTVRVPSQQHEISAAFEDPRDFSLSICILNKSGFTIRDEEPSPPSPEPSAYNQAGIDLGPRLSSITPLAGSSLGYGSAAHGGLSLTSFLEPSSTPPRAVQNPVPDELVRGHYAQRNACAISPVHPRQMTSDSLLNPYNIFLNNQNGNLHRPRVASPLRNSFVPSEAVEQRPEPGCATAAARGNGNAFRSISSPGIPARRDDHDPASSPISRIPSHAMEPVDGDPAPVTVDRGQAPVSQAAAQSFRDLMPQRRHLPFAQGKPAAMSPSQEAMSGSQTDGNGQRLPSSPILDGSAGERAESRPEHHQGREDDSGDERWPSTGDEPDRPAAESTNMACQASSSQSETEPCRATGSSPPGPMVARTTSCPVRHTVLLADSPMFRQLNKLAAGLLEQYEADVARGCNEGICAQFYLERLQSQRRDFWLSQLMGVDPQERALFALPRPAPY